MGFITLMVVFNYYAFHREIEEEERIDHMLRVRNIQLIVSFGFNLITAFLLCYTIYLLANA